MSNLANKLSKGQDVSAKVAQLLQTRTKLALTRFNERAQQAREQIAGLTTNPASLSELWASGARYGVDFAQRSTCSGTRCANAATSTCCSALAPW